GLKIIVCCFCSIIPTRLFITLIITKKRQDSHIILESCLFGLFQWPRLIPGGSFVFSVEHPIFTSRSEQDWYYDNQGNRQHWPVDNYQSEGIRQTTFLNNHVTKYHRTISTYLNDLINAGFIIRAVKESVPSNEMLKSIPGMEDEKRR